MGPRVRITDVAQAAGISIASASVALNGKPGVSEETRSRILAVAAELGYQPDTAAQRLRNEHSRLVGVTFELDVAFHGQLLGHVYEAVEDAGLDLVLSGVTPTRPTRRAAQSLLRDRCEALVLLSPEIGDDELAALAARTGTVAVSAEVRVSSVDSVRSDDRAGTAGAVDHLVGLGHREIAYVDAGPALLNDERRGGYEDAMTRHGLGAEIRVLAAGLVKDQGRKDGPAVTEVAGAAAAERLLAEKDLPTALITYNDRVAVGILLTLRSRGVRVPQDVSIVGYDDTRFAGLGPIALTSVHQDVDQLARAAVNCALARTEGREPPGGAAHIVVTPRLVVRSTTSPPRP